MARVSKEKYYLGIAGFPCDRCKRVIINAGLERVITYLEGGRLVEFNVRERVIQDKENYIKNFENI